MGFWDEHQQDDYKYEQLPFASDEQKKAWMQSASVLLCFAIRTGDTEFGERWYVDVFANDGDSPETGDRLCVSLSKGKVSTRDAMLKDMSSYLSSAPKDETIPFIMAKEGRSIVLRSPDEQLPLD